MNEDIADLPDSVDQIETVTAETFDSVVLNSYGPIAVEFMSYGCAYCQGIEPVLQQVAEMIKSKEEIVRVNVEVEPGLANSYGIKSTPTLVMFMDGLQVGRAEGPNPTISSVLTAVTQPFNS